MAELGRDRYAALYGPTTGDQVRLGDTDLWVEVEDDLTFGGDEAVFGGGKSIRSFIHMRDVSEATLRIALEGRVGETYHISTDRMVSIRELVAMILERLGKEFDACVEIAPERPGKDQAYMLDSTKLRSELGWRDAVGLEDGIAECVAWAERFRDHLLSMKSWDYEHKP